MTGVDLQGAPGAGLQIAPGQAFRSPAEVALRYRRVFRCHPLTGTAAIQQTTRFNTEPINLPADYRSAASASPIGGLTKPKTIRQNARCFALWRAARARPPQKVLNFVAENEYQFRQKRCQPLTSSKYLCGLSKANIAPL